MTTSTMINGINTTAIMALVADIEKDPKAGMVSFGVTSSWKGTTRMEATVSSWSIAGQSKPRQFVISTDEPNELCGENSAPNPQETLMAAMNACMMVGYVANAALMGITLEQLEIVTEGSLDLRGFLGLSNEVTPGNSELHYHIRVKGDGNPAQYEELHEKVIATSPNRWNLANPVKINASLEVL